MDVTKTKNEMTIMLSNVRCHLNHTLAPGESSVPEAPSLSSLRSEEDFDWRIIQFVSIAVAEKMERDLGVSVIGGNKYENGKFS